MNNMRGFDAAQRAYDNMTPPDDGPSECPDCKGSGLVTDHAEGGEIACEACSGHGFLDDGEPFDPHAAEYAAEQYADMKRDEGMTS